MAKKSELKVIHQILCLADVSSMLHCSSDTVLRIPKSALPTYRVGKSNLYLHDEVIRYVRSCRVDTGPAIQSLQNSHDGVDALIHRVLDSATVDAGEPSLRRVK